jgi:hypothetical protein
VVSPLAAKASMTVGVYLNPIGTGLQSTEYLTPDNNGTSIPLYVYAIVTGTGPVTTTATGSANLANTGNFDGLQYLYYNLVAQGGNAAGLTGGITATTLNSTLGFDSSTPDGSGNASAGVASQTGLVDLTPGSTLGNAGSGSFVAVGASSAFGATSPISSSVMTQFAKPRAGGPVWSNYGVLNGPSGSVNSAVDGTNIIVGNGSNGVPVNSVAFLVEKFNYTPSAFNASAPGSLTAATFSIGTPFNGSTSILASSSYAPSNSFNDSSSPVTVYNSASGSSISKLTSSYYTSGHTVTLTDTIPGDTNGDGRVNSTDLNTVLQDFGQPFTTWAAGNFVGAGNVNSTDLNDVLQYFGQNAGSVPTEIAVDAAVLASPQAVALLESHGFDPVSAVPEPGSFLLAGIGAVSLLGRKRKAH